MFFSPLVMSLAQAYLGLKGISFACVCPFWNIVRSPEIIGKMRTRIKKKSMGRVGRLLNWVAQGKEKRNP
jgi:hypothetical protein